MTLAFALTLLIAGLTLLVTINMITGHILAINVIFLLLLANHFILFSNLIGMVPVIHIAYWSYHLTGVVYLLIASLTLFVALLLIGMVISFGLLYSRLVFLSHKLLPLALWLSYYLSFYSSIYLILLY